MVKGEDPDEEGRSEWTCKCTNKYSSRRSNQSVGPKSKRNNGVQTLATVLLFGHGRKISPDVVSTVVIQHILHQPYFNCDFKRVVCSSLEVESFVLKGT